MSSDNVRPRLQSMTPLLVVSDLQRAIEFCQRGLGFAEPSVWGEPPCFAMLTRDGFGLMLSLAEDPAHVRPNGPNGVWDVYLRVADVAAEMAALKAAGVTIAKGPTDQIYEMREIEIVDPDAHRICVAEDVGGGGLKAAEVWEGVLDIGSSKLRLVLKIATDGGVSKAALDSLDQGAMNLPVEWVERSGNVLRFEMSEIGATFEGVVSADGRSIAGQWSRRGRTWPLVWRAGREQHANAVVQREANSAERGVFSCDGSEFRSSRVGEFRRALRDAHFERRNTERRHVHASGERFTVRRCHAPFEVAVGETVQAEVTS